MNLWELRRIRRPVQQVFLNRRRTFIDGLIDSERYNVVLKVMGANVLHK